MKPKTDHNTNARRAALLYLLFVLVTSFFTYVYRYNFPSYPFWDEPYHIAAAQKYLNGVHFMEPHPPLGKLLIALGEKITQSNSDEKNAAFITTDYATGLDQGYSFTGYRLFPSLLGWLTAPLLFLIFLWFTKNPALSSLLSFLYIFDNAQIVHSRGAMVDVPVTFFGMLLILIFLYLQERKLTSTVVFLLLSLASGIVFGLIMTTKIVGLIFILVFAAAYVRLFPDWRKIVILTFFALVGFVVTFIAVWQIHFSLGGRVVPELHTGGYYLASEEYKTIVNEHRNTSLLSFPIMLRDNFSFVPHYQQGVPRLDLCKPDENGSPAYFWPLGARTINYRWERVGEEAIRYLYLQSNPVGWALGFLGVFLAGFLLLTRVLNPQGQPKESKEKLQHGFFLLMFFGLYAAYMLAILQIDRVMYLYHYFIPLLFSYILFGLAFINIRQIGSWKMDDNRRLLVMTFLSLLIFGSFQMYRALSYYEPISRTGMERLSLFPLWELTCVDCEKESGLVVPVVKNPE